MTLINLRINHLLNAIDHWQGLPWCLCCGCRRSQCRRGAVTDKGRLDIVSTNTFVGDDDGCLM